MIYLCSSRKSVRLAPALLNCAVLACWASLSEAKDHRVEVLSEAPSEEQIAAELRKQLSDKGFRVIEGASRTVLDIWPTRQWQVAEGFQPTAERLYPFKPGDLLGVVRFPRRGKDFRDQQISRGWYTLRYGLQPIDGNHEGTSPTRDFLVLVKAAEDDVAKRWETEELMQASAAAARSNHPAMLCLQAAQGEQDRPTIRHDADREWWILQIIGKATAGQSRSQLPVDIVVVGQADE